MNEMKDDFIPLNITLFNQPIYFKSTGNMFDTSIIQERLNRFLGHILDSKVNLIMNARGKDEECTWGPIDAN